MDALEPLLTYFKKFAQDYSFVTIGGHSHKVSLTDYTVVSYLITLFFTFVILLIQLVKGRITPVTQMKWWIPCKNSFKPILFFRGLSIITNLISIIRPFEINKAVSLNIFFRIFL